jgi:hypothetical protein
MLNSELSKRMTTGGSFDDPEIQIELGTFFSKFITEVSVKAVVERVTLGASTTLFGLLFVSIEMTHNNVCPD